MKKIILKMSLNISNTTTTAEQTKRIEYGEIQKSGVQCTVGAVCIIVCYLTYFIIETLISQSNTYSLHLVVFWRLTIGLV